MDLSAYCGSEIQFGIEVFPPVWDPSASGEIDFDEAWRDRGDGWYINNVLVEGEPTL